MYEPMEDVLITHADEDKVLSMCIASTEVKVNSVYEYIEFLMNWTELKCFRSKRDSLKPVKKFSNVVNKRSSRYKYL